LSVEEEDLGSFDKSKSEETQNSIDQAGHSELDLAPYRKTFEREFEIRFDLPAKVVISPVKYAARKGPESPGNTVSITQHPSTSPARKSVAQPPKVVKKSPTVVESKPRSLTGSPPIIAQKPPIQSPVYGKVFPAPQASKAFESPVLQVKAEFHPAFPKGPQKQIKFMPDKYFADLDERFGKKSQPGTTGIPVAVGAS
jgi:hypothetical protein